MFEAWNKLPEAVVPALTAALPKVCLQKREHGANAIRNDEVNVLRKVEMLEYAADKT